MVGGRIVSIREESDRLCIIVAKKVYSRHESMGIDIAKTEHKVELGDQLWWQGEFCYWTPDGQKEPYDIPIRRKSYSYSVGITS